MAGTFRGRGIVASAAAMVCALALAGVVRAEDGVETIDGTARLVERAVDGSLVFLSAARLSDDLHPLDVLHGTWRGIEITRLNPLGAVDLRIGFGGTFFDRANDIALAPNGDIIVVGETFSPDLPTTAAFQPFFAGGTDAFVARFDPSGSLVYCTYIGGSGEEGAIAVDVDQSGRVFLVGFTTSTDFPTSPFPIQGVHADGLNPLRRYDLWVSRLSADGSSLDWSTYYGGAGAEYPGDIVVAPDGAPTIVGWSHSIELNVVNAFQPSKSFSVPGDQTTDGIIVRFEPDGSAIRNATYLGGKGFDAFLSAALAPDGSLVIGGRSDAVGMPVVSGREFFGNTDAIVLRMTPALDDVSFATYIGHDNDQLASRVAVEPDGSILAIGTGSGLPGTDGSLDGGFARDWPGFFARFDPDVEQQFPEDRGEPTHLMRLASTPEFVAHDGPDFTLVGHLVPGAFPPIDAPLGPGAQAGDVAIVTLRDDPVLSVTNLRLSDISQSRLGIRWDDARPDDVSLRVLRRGDGFFDPHIEVGTLNGDDTVFVDTDLQPNTPYTYGVESRFSNGLLATTGPFRRHTLALPVTNLNVEHLGRGDIQVTWDYSDPDIVAFQIFRRVGPISSDEFGLVGSLPATARSFLDNVVTGPRPDLLITYRVVVLNESGPTFAQGDPIPPTGDFILTVKRGKVAFRGGFDDTLDVSAKLAKAETARFHPSFDDLALRLSSGGRTFELVIPARDPGWTVGPRRAKWTSSDPDQLGSRVIVDLRRGRVKVKLRGQRLPVLDAKTMTSSLRLGDRIGGEIRPWRKRGGGQEIFRR